TAVGRTVTFLAQAAGFGFGCFAAGFAVHGAAKTLQSADAIAQQDDAATASLTALTITVLVAAALTWQGRQRRHEPR
ncbi:hypothetical protein ABZY93_35665, partial [Streptomyces smyrnaeus]|uniref:hypothetical protein n=1 Tax=Streptomyces smyrnaeus TaxID=1387713 RepID=UPI0033B4AD44